MISRKKCYSHFLFSDNKPLAADVKVDVKEAGSDATGDAAQLSGPKTTPIYDDIKLTQGR